MNLLRYLNLQAGGGKTFHIDSRLDGWRIKPRNFSTYHNNEEIIASLSNIEGIKSAQLEKCSLCYSLEKETLIVRTTLRPKDIIIPNVNIGELNITDDIHYSSCYGLVSRSEALDNAYEVELNPYIEKGKYTYTKYKEGILLIHIDGGEDVREFELNFEADWLEFV